MKFILTQTRVDMSFLVLWQAPTFRASSRVQVAEPIDYQWTFVDAERIVERDGERSRKLLLVPGLLDEVEEVDYDNWQEPERVTEFLMNGWERRKKAREAFGGKELKYIDESKLLLYLWSLSIERQELDVIKLPILTQNHLQGVSGRQSSNTIFFFSPWGSTTPLNDTLALARTLKRANGYPEEWSASSSPLRRTWICSGAT